jgi:hypothetical protein
LVSSYWTLLLYFVRGDLLHFLAQLSVYPSEESPPAHRRRFGLDPIFTKSFGVRKSVPAHKSGPPRWHCICCATLKNPVIPTATAKPVLTRQVFYLPWKLNPSPQLLIPVQWLSATRLWSAGIGSRPRQMLTAILRSFSGFPHSAWKKEKCRSTTSSKAPPPMKLPRLRARIDPSQ